ncbi:hypothetical protein ACMFMG_011590 [Clarireedia jacksonii]
MAPQSPQTTGQAVGTPTTPPSTKNRPGFSSDPQVSPRMSTSKSIKTTPISNLADRFARSKVDETGYRKIRLKDKELEVLHEFLKTERHKDQRRSNEAIFEAAIRELSKKCGEECQYKAQDLQNYWMTRGKKHTGLDWPPEDEVRLPLTAGRFNTPRHPKIRVCSSIEQPTFQDPEWGRKEWTEKEDEYLLKFVNSARAAEAVARPYGDSEKCFWLKIREQMRNAGYCRTENQHRDRWKKLRGDVIQDDEQVHFHTEKEAPKPQVSTRPLPPKDRYNSHERVKHRSKSLSNKYKKGSGTSKSQNTEEASGRRGVATESPLGRALEHRKRQAANSAEKREVKKRRNVHNKRSQTGNKTGPFYNPKIEPPSRPFNAPANVYNNTEKLFATPLMANSHGERSSIDGSSQLKGSRSAPPDPSSLRFETRCFDDSHSSRARSEILEIKEHENITTPRSFSSSINDLFRGSEDDDPFVNNDKTPASSSQFSGLDTLSSIERETSTSRPESPAENYQYTESRLRHLGDPQSKIKRLADEQNLQESLNHGFQDTHTFQDRTQEAVDTVDRKLDEIGKRSSAAQQRRDWLESTKKRYEKEILKVDDVIVDLRCELRQLEFASKELTEVREEIFKVRERGEGETQIRKDVEGKDNEDENEEDENEEDENEEDEEDENMLFVKD